MQFLKSEKIFNGALITWTILVWQWSFVLCDELPGDLKPLQYILKLFTNLDEEVSAPKFWGQVKIKVECTKQTEKIILHKESLAIKHEHIKVLHIRKRVAIEVDRAYAQKELGLYIIVLKNKLEKGEIYAVNMKFRSARDYNAGYIVNQTSSMAYSLTDKHVARHIFPCFDQADMKAKFKIILGHDQNISAYTNSRLSGKYKVMEKRPGWIVEEFEPLENTVSTYSINFALSRMPCITFNGDDNLQMKIQICADDAYMELKQHIFQLLFVDFHFMLYFLQVSYPPNKFDMIIEQYGYSDMTEGYGLVNAGIEYFIKTDEEDLLLRLCYVVCYQWIGHMITMELAEYYFQDALNIFLQWQCATNVNEKYYKLEFRDYEWDSTSSFLGILKREEIGDWLSVPSDESDWAIGLRSAHIKQRTAHHIRMIYFFLGPDIFRDCLKEYLTTNQFKNTNISQFWDTFTHTIPTVNRDFLLSSLNIQKVMNLWTYGNGFPLIIVERDESTDMVTVRQEPFTISTENMEENERREKKCWEIPLYYTIGNDDEHMESKLRKWLPCHNEKINLDSVPRNSWLLVNMNLSVPSRVHYYEGNWLLLSKIFLDDPKNLFISIAARVRTVSDMFAMAKVGKLSYDLVFKTMKYLRLEKSSTVWKVAMEEFHEIRSLLLGTNITFHKRFKKYMRDFLRPIFQEKTISNDFVFLKQKKEKKLKKVIVEQACTFDVEECIKTSSNILKNNPNFEDTSKNKIPYSINKVIHCEQVKRNNRHWMNLWNQYITSSTSSSLSNETKEGIFEALGCSREKKLLKRALVDSLNSEYFSIDDTIKIFRGLSSNVRGYDIMKTFFIKYYNEIMQKAGDFGEDHILPYWKILLDSTTNWNDLNELREFAFDNNVDLENGLMKISIRKARNNIIWLENNLQTIDDIIPQVQSFYSTVTSRSSYSFAEEDFLEETFKLKCSGELDGAFHNRLGSMKLDCPLIN